MHLLDFFYRRESDFRGEDSPISPPPQPSRSHEPRLRLPWRAAWPAAVLRRALIAALLLSDAAGHSPFATSRGHLTLPAAVVRAASLGLVSAACFGSRQDRKGTQRQDQVLNAVVSGRLLSNPEPTTADTETNPVSPVDGCGCGNSDLVAAAFVVPSLELLGLSSVKLSPTVLLSAVRRCACALPCVSLPERSLSGGSRQSLCYLPPAPRKVCPPTRLVLRQKRNDDFACPPFASKLSPRSRSPSPSRRADCRHMVHRGSIQRPLGGNPSMTFKPRHRGKHRAMAPQGRPWGGKVLAN